ncbi:MAG TPA: oligopeptidase A, partial [Aeromonadales bacterium]|nr:oligopeptidase A [Aeromonadales bacterium]
MNNPLLESHSLPPFQDIEIKHIVPAIKELIDSNQAQIDTILNNETDYNWFSLVEPMEKLDLKLGNAWSPVSHMHSVVDSEALRQAYDECLPMLTEYSTAMGQNRQLFAAYNAIKQKHFSSLDNVQQKIMDDALRDFKLAGIALEGNEKIRFGEIRKRLSELTSNYEKNVLDATMAWSLNFDDDTRLKGLPDSALAQAKQSAETVKQKGYRITLEFPSYYAVISYAEDRKLRQEIYSAFCTRASDQGPDAGQYDNSELMVEILSLRHELSQLLGFDNYADLSLATKMAENAQ